MKGYILDFKDITDTREIYEANPPPFMSIFIYGILSMIVLSITWMWFGDINEVVLADGIVRTKDPVSIVTNIVEGEVNDVFFEEDIFVNKGDTLFTLETTTYRIERESVSAQLNRLEARLGNLKLLEESIDRNKNLFDEANIEFHNRFNAYSYELELLNLAIVQAKAAYDRHSSMQLMVSEATMEELESRLKVAELNLRKYKSRHKVEIKEERDRIESEIIILTEKLDNLSEKIDLCNIKAPISGKVQVVTHFNPGDYLRAGTEIARIIPETDSLLKVELIISNKDIAKIERGRKIRYSFLSLPQNRYGFAEGEVITIGSDISMRQTSKDPVFVVEGSLDTPELTDSNGVPTAIKTGMICSGRIIIRQKKIIEYVLETLNFLP
ncbi:MAG: HlyD family efflux transporter periplasmic adaptor subunit [Spirochaetales bacterium]|nr:HlyD family efflux transporter periplasmic adaptor subunit [Spirochaetales bacterium]